MNFLTILASVQHNGQVAAALGRIFASFEPVSDQENLFQVKTAEGNEAQVRILFHERSGDAGDIWLRGLRDFYVTLPYQDAAIKPLVLTQLSVVNVIVVARTEADFDGSEDDPLYGKFMALARELDGIVYLEDSTLTDRTGKVIVYPDGRKGEADFMPVAAEKMVIGTPPQSTEGMDRKTASIEKLKARGIRTIDHLPELPPAAAINPRTRIAAARRAATALVIIQFACDIAHDQMDIDESRALTLENLKKYRLEPFMTERERAFLYAREPDRTEATQIVWQYEAYWVLIWALNLLDELSFPDSICDTDAAIAALFSSVDIRAFYRKTEMRAISEILDEADLNYRCNWACTQSRLDGEEPAGGMNPGVVMERKRAFDWLLRLAENDWDAIAGSDGDQQNELLIGGDIIIEGVTHCVFQSHEDVLEDDSWCFYGYKTAPGAQIRVWDRTVSFRAQVSPKGTPIVLKSRQGEEDGSPAQMEGVMALLEECQEVLVELQKQAMPRADMSRNMEIQQYYDAQGLFEQLQAFAAVFADSALDFAEQCEKLTPLFIEMKRIVADAAESMPEEFRREDNGYGLTLFQLFTQVAGVRGRVEKEGLSLSDAFTRAAYDLQLAVEEAYDALAETREYVMTDEDEIEIRHLENELNNRDLPVKRRIRAARLLWDDARLDVSRRIDYVDAVIDLATAMISDAEDETEKLMDDLIMIESHQWDNPEPAIAAINRQIELLGEMQGDMTGPFINLLSESPIKDAEGKSTMQQAMDFMLESVEVTVRESEETAGFEGSMSLLFRDAPADRKGHAIRVWMDDGLITGMLPSWK
ncbi:DUF4272 domain-containing protein [Oxalobacter sp. OttesenSCG-928-P03]|nr:DUF4272 domain-containing protein [Oxalobacter sp. OttesenSCG-928-P03]